MRKLVIERGAVRANMAVVRKRAAGAALYGVLTGDGGGAGLVPMARMLRDEGVGRFAVGSVEEAQELREAGFVDEEILMLRATVDREELERLVDLNVVCTISSVDTGLALNAVAENRSTVAEAHIQVDTGMGFGGFLVGEPEKILLAYRSLPNVALSGIYTQLHVHSGKEQEVGGQLKQFHQVLDAIHAAGFETGLVHAAGSYALMHFDSARLDAVRAGSVLLGRCRRTRGDGLRRVGYGEVGKNIVDPQIMAIRRNVAGDRILVEQRNTAPMPDVLNRTDTLYINIQVRGSGDGERGKARASELAMELYRRFNLILDQSVGGTLYLCMTPDSAPYEVEGSSENSREYLFGLEVTRYYGD